MKETYENEISRYVQGYTVSKKKKLVPVSEREYERFQKERNEAKAYWKDRLKSPWISRNDIIRAMWGEKRYRIDRGMLGARVEREISKHGYYSFTDRTVYSTGAKFWRLKEIEHIYPDICKKIEEKIESLDPVVSEEGNLIKHYYPYYDLTFCCGGEVK